MGNFFKDIGDSVVDQVKAPFKGVSGAVSNLVKGDFGDAWDDIRHIPGDINRGLSKGYKAVIGDNWVSQNPLEATAIAAAIAAGGPAVLSAVGGGASAAGAGAAGTAAGTAGTVGGSGMLSGSSLAGAMQSGGGMFGGGSLGAAGSSGIGSGAMVGATGPLSGAGIADAMGFNNGWKKMSGYGDIMKNVGDALSQSGQGGGTVTARASSFNPSFRPIQDNSMQTQMLNAEMKKAMGSAMADTDYTALAKKPNIDKLLEKLG